MSASGLSRSVAATIPYRVSNLAGVLPAPHQEWEFGDTDLAHSEFQWMVSNNLIEKSGSGWRTREHFAAAVQDKSDMENPLVLIED